MNNEQQAYTESVMQELARFVDGELPEGWVFVILAFPFGGEPGARVNYVSSANRDDMIRAMKEFLERNESGEAE